MINLIDLEKKINSELTTKINKTEIKHNQLYIEIDKEDLISVKIDKAKKLSTPTPMPGGRGDAPLSMPVLVDKGQVTNIQSNYGSTLSVDNGNRTSRLFTDSLLIDVRSAYAGQ